MLKGVLEKIKHFEGMTWGEIEGREHHFISVTRINRQAKKRLEEINKAEFQNLFSFRLSGKERLWGILILLSN